jgi:diguanylate cyclase (GGDEF)-like protein
LLFFVSISGNLWLLHIENPQSHLQIVSFFLNAVIALLIFFTINRFVDFKTYFLTNKDEVSDLYNKKAFAGLLSAEIKRIHRTNQPLCTIFFDIDSYKRTSDRQGQKKADALIKKFSSILSSTIRESDTASRLNLDTFAVLAIGSNKANAANLLARLFEQLEKDGFDNNLSRSYAVVVQVDETDSAQSVLDKGFGMIFEDKSQNIISMLKTPRLVEDDED